MLQDCVVYFVELPKGSRDSMCSIQKLDSSISCAIKERMPSGEGELTIVA